MYEPKIKIYVNHVALVNVCFKVPF